MIIKNKHELPKKIIIGLLVALLLMCAPIYVYVFKGNLFGWKSPQNSINNSSIDYGPATEEQKQAGSQTKSGSSDTPQAPTTISGSDKKSVQITITAANQNESTIQVRSFIGAVDNTGICTLTLTNTTTQSIVTKTAATQALASTSTCQGFDIPISELSIGPWHILIEFSSSALTGSATKDIVIK